MRKALTLEDIDYRAKARKDLPYLKAKALEYLNKYTKATTIDDRIQYIKLHFTYMDWYHGTMDALEQADIDMHLKERED